MKKDFIQNNRIKEIREWARMNNNHISYFTLRDLLKFENQPIIEDENEEEITNKIIRQLSEDGIIVDLLEESEDWESGEQCDESFIPANVNITPVIQNITNLMDRLSNEEIDLMPSFQRKNGLWDEKRQSRLIESLMLRIPIPSFYFDMIQEDKWKVIDGLQRLTTFKNFLVGEEKNLKDGTKILEKHKFTGMQYLRDFNGKTFDELPRQYIRRVKEASVTVYGVMKGTPEQVVFNIFQRLNTGGLKLEPQEIRNAMYHGKASELAKELAGSHEFLKATMFAVPSARMLDQEYVIRYIAFTELDYKTEYKDDIDRFLITAMKRVNEYQDKEIQKIKEVFTRVMKYSWEIFGINAFRKVGMDGRRGPINKVLFEMVSVVFSTLDTNQLNHLVIQKKMIEEGYRQLFQNHNFSMAIRSGKKNACIRRIKIFEEMVNKYL